MGIQITCTHCGHATDLTDAQVQQYAGQTITCTSCRKDFVVGANVGHEPHQPTTVGYATPQALLHSQKTNGMAIASLVCGLLGFVVLILPSVLGIICGVVGLRRTRDPAVGGKGLAIAGISVGAASFLVSGCMLSALIRSRESAHRVHCASNMRQIGHALLLYANENGGAYPPRLEDLLLTQDISSLSFVCVASGDSPAPGTTPQMQATSLSAGGHLSYVYVPGQGSRSPADAILLFEALSNHGNDGCNVLFGDGHVEFLSRPQAEVIIDKVKAGENPPRMPPGNR